MKIVPVIISGGAGSRLWPASRQAFPKPFIKLKDGFSLIQHTLRRVREIPDVVEMVTVTNRDLLFLTLDEYAGLRLPDRRQTFILEPEGRDTAAAIAAAALHAQAAHGDDAVLCIFPSDHLISDLQGFIAAIGKAVAHAKSGRIVTFGIKPTGPQTGFGYIEADEENVLRFVEKPNLETARTYVESGRFLWNSGMFCFTAGAMVSALENHAPDVIGPVRGSLQAARVAEGDDYKQIELDAAHFAAARKISIDFAVMEKAADIAVVPCDIGWNDIGSWSAFADTMDADSDGNRFSGDVIAIDTSGTYVRETDRLVAMIGVSDLVIIDEPDALLVAAKAHAGQVKDVYERLKRSGNDAHIVHRTAHRPWGSYTVLEAGHRFKIKRIEVKPGGRLSLQKHHHRSEHWVVVSGTAKIVNGDKEVILATNQSTYIPSGTVHRMENPEAVPLVLIEVQSGDYLGEDDIVRLEDNYGRV